jgi:hypothetical protein
MISLKPIIDLLKPAPADFARPWFRQVGGSAEYARLNPSALPLPACWIVRAADRVKHAGERAEDVGLAFDVVMAIANVREFDQAAADDVLLQYRRAVYALLLGYEIDGESPITFAGGQLLEVTAQDMYWRDRYGFSAIVTNYFPDPVPDFSDIQSTEATSDHYF